MATRRQHSVLTNTSFSTVEDQRLATRILNDIGPFCASAGFKPRSASEWHHNKSNGRISVAMDPADPAGVLDIDQVHRERESVKAATSLLYAKETDTWFLTVQEARLRKIGVWQVLLGLVFLAVFFYAIYVYGARHELWCTLMGTCREKKN